MRVEFAREAPRLRGLVANSRTRPGRRPSEDKPSAPLAALLLLLPRALRAEDARLIMTATASVATAGNRCQAPKPLVKKKIVKKRNIPFPRYQSDEYVKVKSSWRRPR